MESSISSVENYVDALFNNDSNTEIWQEADDWIRHWQHSEGVFDQCFAIISREISSSNINSNLMFISIKTIQDRIRFSFSNIPSETIQSILECFTEIVKIYASAFESEESSNDEDIVIAPQLRYSLISICDIITITESFFEEIGDMIPDCLKMLFLALFFEDAQESYLKSIKKTNSLIQYNYIEYGIEFLLNSPMSTEWVECFGGIVKIVGSYEMIVPLMSRLPETLTSINTISILLDVLCNIYGGTFQFKPFLAIIVEFHISYSQALREIADSDPRIHQFLQDLWNSFFQVNLYELESTELILASFTEFFEVANILYADVLSWAELLNNAIKILSEKIKNKELASEMEPVKIIFFQLCSRRFVQLIELYCKYKSNQSEYEDDSDFSEQSPYAYDHVIKNLNTLSKKVLNYFLLEEEPKTIGLLKIAGMNAKFLDRNLLCQYADYALSFTDDAGEGEVLVVCSFINSSFETILEFSNEYIVSFISYEIQAFPLIPLHASYILLNISKKHYESFIQVDDDILIILLNLFKYGHVPSKANLILTLLNIISHADQIDLDNPILQQITLFCEQFANFAQTDFHNLEKFVEFVRYLSRHSQHEQLALFYNNISISMINNLGDTCKELDNEYQYQITLFFETLISRNVPWLREYSIPSEYVQQAIENGITQTFHLNKIVSNLPPEFIPLKIFEVCNNAFIPAIEATANKNMNVNIADYLCGEKEAENIIDSISYLIFHIIQNRSFEHLNLFNPQLFTEIILRTKNHDKCDHIYRTIDQTINLCNDGEVPHEILVCILRGCTRKAFNCKSYEMRFLVEPMKKLSKLLPQDEYAQLFLGAIPEYVLQSAQSEEDNPAMDYLNAILNPLACKPIDFTNAIDNFVKFMTTSIDESVE